MAPSDSDLINQWIASDCYLGTALCVCCNLIKQQKAWGEVNCIPIQLSKYILAIHDNFKGA